MKDLLTEGFYDHIELIQVRATRPQWFTGEHLSDYATNRPNVYRRAVLSITN